MKRTKIICTLGPASDTEEMIKKLFNAGMNVGRLNFSHGTHSSHLAMITKFRKVRDALGIPAAVLLDTKGPEVRLGKFKKGKCTLKTGSEFVLTNRDIPGDENICQVNYDNLHAFAKKGHKILIDDGMITLTVKKIEGPDIICRVTEGGPVSDHKGVNLKGVSIDMPYLSQKDKDDLLFGISNNVDYIAASFVRTKQDVIDLRQFLDSNGGEDIKIIAKIENSEGVRNYKRILDISDGIMVARGDMGVEIDFEKLPGIQKKIINECCTRGKIAITATQMLESMTTNPRPTRAEITDIANAVFDGTSAVMLSGESAAGKYPVQAVKAMSKIAIQAEKDAFSIDLYRRLKIASNTNDTTSAVAHAAFQAASDLDVKCILAITKSGTTAVNISKYRPEKPIAACTPSKKTFHQLALCWGVMPIKTRTYNSFTKLYEASTKALSESKIAKSGEMFVATGGTPVQIEGKTNLIRIDSLK